ncbi:hypothetical protein [Synechococcus sp. CS-1332]|uniref:hypothetical protein n=1 Tax=Synechococcus sp. CS-1332 TaxID=2847972 RepID=UPI00223C2A81|nr:hypothetical protein [Synechococcus sp. CS-1332]MCT0206973.1 hypothetical protein [Synechococcus sp. CS-1332]
MHLFIHIGTHKTGTTSLQAFLYEHSAEMVAAGIYVPVSGTVNEASGKTAVHHNLAFELMGDSRYDQARGGLNEMVAELRDSNTHAAIISSEELSYLVENPEGLHLLEHTLYEERHSISWLMFCRRVDDYSESLYGLLMGCGIRPSLGYAGFVLKILLNGKYTQNRKFCRTVHYFDFADFACRWRSLSSSPLHLLDYDRAASGSGVLPSFLRAIGAPSSLIDASGEAPRRNPRREKVLCRYRRLLRPLLMARFHRSNLQMLNG